jgi:hypothetical protein
VKVLRGALAFASGLTILAVWPTCRTSCDGRLGFRAAAAVLDPVPRNAQTALVRTYLNALRDARFDAAFRLLDRAERVYYRNADNLRSMYAADAYRVIAFTLLGARGDETRGRVYFARETARFRDHAHDTDLTVTATVPLGIVAESAGWRIKDPGHPWSAFAVRASARANGIDVTVKKLSFFARRIELVLTFVNTGTNAVTILPYGKSVLRDAAGHPYRLIETRDWSLTDRVLFEGLRLPPNARYTGTLAFACEPIAELPRSFALTVAPLLADGADAPFEIRVDAIGADAAAR